jgi:hypothetical protein
LAEGEIVECDVEGRLPERDIFAGAPPVSDTQYYEVIEELLGGDN